MDNDMNIERPEIEVPEALPEVLPEVFPEVVPQVSESKFDAFKQKLLDRLNRSKRLVILSVVVFTVLLFSGIYFKAYSDAKSDFLHIEAFAAQGNYKQAYSDLIEFKGKHVISNFPQRADQKLKELNAISEDKYIEGIRMIGTDKSGTYSSVETYFKDYKLNFPYSTKIARVDTLINDISDLKKSTDEYNTYKSLQDYISANGDIVSSLDKYIKDGIYIHNLAYVAVNSPSSSNLMALYSEWKKNSSYYQSIATDLTTIKDKDFKNTLFAADEYNDIRRFLASAFLPGEAVYNMINFGNSGGTDSVRQSWNTYDSLENKVTSIINSKKQAIKNYGDKVVKLEEEIGNLKKKIAGFE